MDYPHTPQKQNLPVNRTTVTSTWYILTVYVHKYCTLLEGGRSETSKETPPAPTQRRIYPAGNTGNHCRYHRHNRHRYRQLHQLHHPIITPCPCRRNSRIYPTGTGTIPVNRSTLHYRSKRNTRVSNRSGTSTRRHTPIIPYWKGPRHLHRIFRSGGK